jgi:chromosome segregation ATPase
LYLDKTLLFSAVNYNPPMDKEGLQRQLDTMEEAAERWRTERRRLNAEIDKLEAELADTKAALARKKASTTESKSSGIDPSTLIKLQEAADEKLKRAGVDWEAERTQLKSQINRLEGAVAEAIARASNPLRATQSVKEQFEVELNRVAKEKTELEQAFLRGKTEWEQEKLKMAGEMVKLRRAAQIMGRPIPKDEVPEINPKVRDLENQLHESLDKWNAERERLVAEIHRREESARQWDTERRQLNDHAGQLQQAFLQAQAKIQAFEVAARAPNVAEEKLQDVKSEKETLQRQLQNAQSAWEAERRRYEQQLQRMSDSRDRVSNEVVDQLRKQYEQKLQEAISQKTQLAQELQTASSLLETERARLSAAQTGGGGGGLDTEAIAAEVSRVETQITQIIAVIDNPETELSTVIRKNVEKAELDAYLRGILYSLGKK